MTVLLRLPTSLSTSAYLNDIHMEPCKATLLTSASFSAVGTIPFLDFLLDKNPLVRIGPPNLFNITNVAIEHVVARTQVKDLNFNPTPRTICNTA